LAAFTWSPCEWWGSGADSGKQVTAKLAKNIREGREDELGREVSMRSPQVSVQRTDANLGHLRLVVSVARTDADLSQRRPEVNVHYPMGEGMRRVLSVFMIFSLLRFCLAQTVPPGDLVPLGTGVEIELLENISSETLRAGQPVPFKLVGALAPHGIVLLPSDTRFNGTVRAANPSGHWGKAGAFDLKLEALKLADGTEVRLDFHRPVRRNTRGEKTGEALGGAILMTYYFPLIPVALIGASRKGKPFTIRAGERYLVYVVGVDAPSATEPPKP
jgi:hypothetical protein